MQRVSYVICLLSTICLGQSGPAGVGNSSNNVIWLKADAGTSSTVAGTPVSTWNDQSGNSFVFSQSVSAQQPLYQSGILNGFPAILFDNATTAGQNDKMICPDSPLHDNTNGYSFFTVSRPLNIGTSVLISKRVLQDNNESFMLFFYTSNKLNLDIDGTNNRFGTNYTFANGGSYIADAIYDGTLGNGQRSKLYNGEPLDRYALESSSSVPDYASSTIIGSTDPSDPRPFDGYIAEIVMYRQALNKASRIIVNNYLSAKYNIALAANDYYVGDTPANGNYDFEVAGIGTDTIQPSATSGSNSVFAASATGGLGVTQVSGFDPGDYVFAGHNTGTNAAINTDVSGFTGSDKCRWSRIWYIDVTNAGAALSVNIEFDMSDGGVSPPIANAGNYVLLYRAGLSGNWTALATASGISGDKVLFNNYAVSQDGYYTIGSTVCSISPLPVELISFDAKYAENVQLDWKTASESRCGRFKLSRSSDGIHFSLLGEMACEGAEGNGADYAFSDNPESAGIFYYRLECFDEDGSLSYSEIRSVVVPDAAEFSIFPNPAQSSVTVVYADHLSTHRLLLSDEQGKLVGSFEANDSLIIDLTNLAPGVYYLSDDNGNRRKLVHI